jgi:hypothetical protein
LFNHLLSNDIIEFSGFGIWFAKNDSGSAFLHYFAALTKEKNDDYGAKMELTDLLIFGALFVVAYVIYKALDKKMRP